MTKLFVRKGDKVEVMAGKEKGKRGKVLKAIPAKKRVVVEGLHMMKKAVRPSQKSPQGGLIDIEGSVAVANVQVVCPSCGKAGRLRYRRTESGVVRVCGRCEADIDKE